MRGKKLFASLLALVLCLSLVPLSAGAASEPAACRSGEGTIQIRPSPAALESPPLACPVTVEYNSDGGNVYVDKEQPAAGETVTVTAAPYGGYLLGSVTVTDADGSPVEVTPYDADNGIYTFVMPSTAAAVTVEFKVITVDAVVDFGAGHETFVQNRFGGTYAVDGARITVPIPRGENHTVLLAWETLENLLQDVLWNNPVDNGERLYGYLGRKSMAAYGSEEALSDDKRLAREEAFQPGYVFTALWEQLVRNAVITVTPPACGTEVHYEYKTGIYVWSVPQPQLSVSSPCGFEDDQLFYNTWVLTDLKEYDTNGDGFYGIGDDPIVMTGGNAYKARGSLNADFGYRIDPKLLTVQVVGGTLMSFGNDWTRFEISVPVKHDIPDDADDGSCFAHFAGVELDGVALSAADYTAKAGSTVVTLKAAALQKLAVGSHRVTVLFDDGEAETRLSVKSASGAPATGDSTRAAAWLALTALSGAAILLLGATSRRRLSSGR